MADSSARARGAARRRDGDTRRVSLRLDARLAALLDHFCALHGMSRRDFVERLIEREAHARLQTLEAQLENLTGRAADDAAPATDGAQPRARKRSRRRPGTPRDAAEEGNDAEDTGTWIKPLQSVPDESDVLGRLLLDDRSAA